MANIDFSAWDGSKAMSAGAKADDPAAFYNAICAGKKAGDPSKQSSHALPYRYSPSSAPNAAGVRNALSRLPQTQGLTNKSEAQSKLEGLMKQVQEAEKNRSSALNEMRMYRLEHCREVPGGELRRRSFSSELRGKFIKDGSRTVYEVEGYATVYNRGYEMWDKAGPYTELVEPHALDRSLAGSPDVAFLVNHAGVAMARSRSRNGNPTLILRSDSTGLNIQAWLNADRQDVRDLAAAIDDHDVEEMSFAFRIDEYAWDEDYTQLSLKQLDINRGDVSAVNFGANPFTSIQARASEWLDDLEHMPEVVIREAINRVARRSDAASLIPEYQAAATALIRRNADLYASVAEDVQARMAMDDEDEELVDGPETPKTRSVDLAMREFRTLTKDYQRQLAQLDRTSDID